MAAFQEIGSGTLTVKSRFPDGATSPLPDQSRDDQDTAPPSEPGTAAQVNRLERGDRKIKDQYDAPSHTNTETAKDEAASSRKELAARVSKSISRVLSSHGAVKMAADLELLKRELARCHDALSPLPTESDFLSIIVLVEQALGTKSWRIISTQELQALKRAIDIGMNSPEVNYDHYNRTFRVLTASGWLTGPALELGEDDSPDGEKTPDE